MKIESRRNRCLETVRTIGLKNKVEAIAKVVERNENSTGERKNSTKERERQLKV